MVINYHHFSYAQRLPSPADFIKHPYTAMFSDLPRISSALLELDRINPHDCQ
jgi:hypothetical protein